MSKRQVVGSMSDWSGVLKDFFRQISDGSLTLEHIIDVNEHRNPFEGEAGENWIDQIINREHQYHLNFFGRKINLPKFEKTLKKYGQKQIRQWQKLGLEPHFLPKAFLFQSNNNFPGWKIKPNNWYYEKAAQDKILRYVDGELEIDRQSDKLEEITVLIDTRLKPAYNDGRQMYANDNLLGPIIELLRKDKKIAKYEHGLRSSRFGVSADEWENQIKPVLAKKLGLEINQVRLERVIEANVIPQLYTDMPRKDDGNTNTWVWFEEYFKGRVRRPGGGRSSGYGGLADVCCSWSAYHWYSHGSFRPLIVL